VHAVEDTDGCPMADATQDSRWQCKAMSSRARATSRLHAVVNNKMPPGDLNFAKSLWNHITHLMNVCSFRLHTGRYQGTYRHAELRQITADTEALAVGLLSKAPEIRLR